MCAIAGIIGKQGQIIEYKSVKTMTDKMAHRGPDAQGIYISDNVGLGHRRLSIIGVGLSGNQPMKSSDGKYQIVFNGEIYNYIEVREELAKSGIVFSTETDTEVIIEAYRRWGEDCVNHFNGMWSICIFDQEKKQLFLSRDRLGVKPLYIINRDDFFAFASEMKALTELFPEEKIVDSTQVARYLRGIQEDCDERTFFRNIKNFPPASSAMYDLLTNKYVVRKYWTISSNLFNSKNKSVSTCKAECLELLKDAIRLRLRSDVPVGASLSGGIDSSSIVEITKKVFDRKLFTFSSIYDEQKYNEQEYIECVNKDAESISNYIFPDKNRDVLDDARLLLYYHDCPPFCASPYSGFNVYRGAKNYVKVLMDGQGADELFVGYYFFINEYIREALSQGGRFGRLKAIKIIADCFSIWNKQRLLNESLVIKTLGVSLYKHYDKKLKKFQHREWKSEIKLFSPELLDIDLEMHFEDEENIPEGVLRSQYHEQFHGILPRILHDVDRNSMAHSLEVRLPFLDYRIVEFSYGLQPSLKYRNGWTKFILRKAVSKYLPKKIWSRRNKMGFPAPFEKWMRDRKYEPRIRETLHGLSDRGVVNKDYLFKMYEDQLNGTVDDPDLFFRLFMLELWLQTEIDNKTTKWHL